MKIVISPRDVLNGSLNHETGTFSLNELTSFILERNGDLSDCGISVYWFSPYYDYDNEDLNTEQFKKFDFSALSWIKQLWYLWISDHVKNLELISWIEIWEIKIGWWEYGARIEMNESVVINAKNISLKYEFDIKAPEDTKICFWEVCDSLNVEYTTDAVADHIILPISANISTKIYLRPCYIDTVETSIKNGLFANLSLIVCSSVLKDESYIKRVKEMISSYRGSTNVNIEFVGDYFDFSFIMDLLSGFYKQNIIMNYDNSSWSFKDIEKKKDIQNAINSYKKFAYDNWNTLRMIVPWRTNSIERSLNVISNLLFDWKLQKSSSEKIHHSEYFFDASLVNISNHLGIKLDEVELSEKEELNNFVNEKISELQSNLWKYVAFTEENDWEWETYKFYILVNDDLLNFVKFFYSLFDSVEDLEEISYSFDEYLSLDEVETLVKYSDSWYMSYENWPFEINNELINIDLAEKDSDTIDNAFYKGWILTFLK